MSHRQSKGVLLVGGPWDGQRRAVKDSDTTLRILEAPRTVLLQEPPAQPSEAIMAFRTGFYASVGDRQIFEWQGWEPIA